MTWRTQLLNGPYFPENTHTPPCGEDWNFLEVQAGEEMCEAFLQFMEGSG